MAADPALPRRVTLAGYGLFSCKKAQISLIRTDFRDPVVISASGQAGPLANWIPAAYGRTSALLFSSSESGAGSAESAACGRSTSGSVHVSCVEHLFAAIGALGVRRGLTIECARDHEGPGSALGCEMPLLDGGSERWARALLELGFGDRERSSSSSARRLRVARPGRVEVGASQYEFARAAGENEASVAVTFDTDDARLQRRASWDGSLLDFMERLAPARTFVSEDDLQAMVNAGGRASADPKSVVVLGNEAILAAGRPFSADEPARHKLLDLIGDLTLHGGPPIGAVHALRPGHGATHAAVAQALSRGILVRDP